MNRLIRIFSLFLLISLTFSLPPLRSQGQHSGRPGTAEIVFSSKEETKWTEKREVPFPVNLGQGVKEEPRVDSFQLREDAIGPMKKMSPSTTAPGCAYSGRFTTGVARTFVGDRALYERGRYKYFEGKYEDAIHSFRKLIEEYADSIWIGSAIYWLGEAKFRQDKEDEAFLYFRKVVTKYPESEFYAYALYSCGWVQLEKGAFEEGYRFFHQVNEKSPGHPIAESSLFWSAYCLYSLGRYAETERELEPLIQGHPGRWRPEAEYLMGVSYFRLQKFREAADLFGGFWKRFPKHPLVESARYAFAWSLLSLGDCSGARKTFEEILLAYPGTRFSDPIFWGIVKTYLAADEVEKAVHLHQSFLSHFLPSPWIEQCLFDIGQYYFEKKDYLRAGATFRQLLRTYPESDLQEWVYFMLGECLFNQKDYPGAIDAYLQALEEKRKAKLEPQVFSRLGSAYFYRKNYELAIHYWEKLVSDFPEIPGKNEILYWTAEALLLKQDYRRGAEVVDRLKGDPGFYPKGLNSMGWYHFQKGEWKEANGYFLKLIEAFPEHRTNPSLFLLVGECYLNQNDYPAAKTYLSRLVSTMTEAGPDKEKALYLLGWIAYKGERFDEAIGKFQELLQSHPLSTYRDECQYWIGWSHFRKKEFQRAVEEFQRFVQQYPESPFLPPALLKMGDAYYNLKRYASANQTYSKLVKEFPKSKEAPEAEFGTLFSLYQEKKFDSFIARAEAFVKRYPQNPLASQALMQLGEYYQQNRMGEKAIKTCREIIHLSPGSPGAEDAQLRISFLLKQERRWTEAIEEMEKFLRLYPKSHQVVQTHVEMGDLYILLKEYAKAVEQYEWVIQNYPHHSLVKKAYLGMEEGYQNSGKMEQVEKTLKDLVTKFPQDDIRFEGQLRLGLFYLAQKRPMDAVPVLSAAIRSPEERVASQAHFKLGEAYLEGENRELALLQFSKVVYLYPHRPEVMEEALLKLGTLYMDENKLSEARQIYQKLMEKTKMEDRKELARRMLDRIDKGTIR